MITIRKHNTPPPPKTPAKPHKASKVPEPAEPHEPQLPSIPKSVDWDKIQAIVEKHVGDYLKKVSSL